MPLVRFELRNEYGLGDPELYRAAPKKDDPKAILDGVAVAGLVGILRQLGDLAEFASDIFHDLHEQVTLTSARGRKLLNRIQHLETSLPAYEDAIRGQRSHIHFAYVAGSDWHADPKIEQGHLLSSDLPQYMMDCYEGCQDPPRLFLLDKFDSAGSGACLKRYSDPSYFKRVWAASELEKAEKIQREKVVQKVKKEGSIIKIREVQDGGSSSRHYYSTQLQSPDTDEQQFLTAAAHLSDMKLDTEHGSTSFSSRTRLNYSEQVPDTSSMGEPDELEHDRLSGSNMQIGQSGSFASDIHDKVNVVRSTYDGSPRGSLKEENAQSSPSVAWDEKSEVASRSPYFSSRTRLNYAKQVPDTCSLGLADELEHDRFSGVDLQIGQSGIFASDIHGKLNGLSSTNEGSSCSSLKEENAYRSPSVTWDEKTEIHKPTSPASDDIIVDDIQYLEPLPVSSKQSNMETETSILEALEQDNIIFGTANAPASVISVNYFEDITSETDNYMDALNTLESEAETDSECQTKHEVKSFCNFGYSQIESGTSQMQEAASPSSVFSGAATASGSDSSTNEEESPVTMPSESLGSVQELVQEPEASDPLPDPVYSLSNQLSEHNDLDMSTSGFEHAVDDQPPELGISTTPAIPDRRTADMYKPPGSSPVCISSGYSSQFWTNGGMLGLEPSKPPDFSALKEQSKDCVSDSCNSGYDHSSNLRDTKWHCNVILPNASLNHSSLSANQQYGRNDNVVPQIDLSQYSSSYSDSQLDNMTDIQSFQRHLPAPSSIQPEKIQEVMPTNINAQKGDVTLPRGTEFPTTTSVDSQPNESSQNTMDIASSLSALAQRILANSLQKKPSTSHAPLVDVNADICKQKDISRQNNQEERKSGVVSVACYQENISNIEHVSSKNSITSRSHISGHSSPPLEHMKISFHPMNGLEASKLKLEYNCGKFHESTEDLTFPSFQLLPGSSVPSGDFGSETDDDTFCRSCPCTSEEHLSPRSDSNSELWGQDDMNGEKHHDMYNDLHRISLSSSSVSSFKGFDQINQNDRSNGFDDLEAENTILYFQNGNSLGLPGLDSFTPTSGRLCDSLSPEGSAFQSQNELPPPPPLPPMQWRMTKASVDKEEKDPSVAEIVEHFNVLQAQRFTSFKKQEQNIPMPLPRQPPLLEKMACPFKKPQDQQTPSGQIELNQTPTSELDMKDELINQFRNIHDGQKHNSHRGTGNSDVKRNQLDEREELLNATRNKFYQRNVNGHKEPNNPCVNIQEVDEREELLYQIRNKSFNLRHTSTAKSNVPQATTNVNVAAILEKANAIRQAFVGSDDGGDDDNWSDG